MEKMLSFREELDKIPQHKPYKIYKNEIRMDMNTNLIGKNPVLKKTEKILTTLDLNSYPTKEYDKFKSELRKKFGIDEDMVLIGNGSDEVIDRAMRAMIKPNDKIVILKPSFPNYKTFAIINFASIVETPLKLNGNNWSFEPQKILEEKPKLCIIANPNNPTGNCFDKEKIFEILDNSIVLLDEAYAEFSGETFTKYTKEYKNLLVIRTFSKAYGLAGLRVGYGIGNEEIIKIIEKVIPAYNVNSLSLAIATEALKDEKFLKKTLTEIKKERSFLNEKLKKLGFVVYPSVTNFLLVKPPIDAEKLCKKLEEKGIIIKNVYFENCVRITVGNRKMNKLLLNGIMEIL
ncbi:MAG: histidinol-phosphate transaminase [Candidatus Thermoplasmatota archaeon]